MLTFPEKILFVITALATLYAIWLLANQIARIIARGQGQVDWDLVRQRLIETIAKTLTFQPVFRFRFWPSLFHGLVAWGFIYYLLVNLFDVIGGFVNDFHIPGTVGNLYRLGADILSVAALVGMIALIIRRFGFKPETLTTREEVMISPKARVGIPRDLGYRRCIHPGACWFSLLGTIHPDRRRRSRSLAAFRHAGGERVGRAEPERAGHRRARLFLAGDRHHYGFFPLLLALQTHPPVHDADQFSAEPSTAFDGRAGSTGLR